MVIQFTVAAQAAEVSEEEQVVEVPIDGVTYQARRLTPGQVGLLAVAYSTNQNVATVVWEMIEAMLGKDAVKHLRRLILERRLDMDDLFGGSPQNPKGLVGAIQEEFAGLPTKPSTDSSSSQPTGGRKSTGRSRGKGSIPSDSPSTDS